MHKFLKFTLIIICLIGIFSIYSQPHFSFSGIAAQENIDFSSEPENNIDPNKEPPYRQNSALKIPAISHHIWLTSKTNPLEIKEQDLKFILNTLKALDSGMLKWQHILWVNEPALIPKSLNILQAAGIEVRHIKDLNQSELNDDIETIILQDKNFAKASDLVRYIALAQFGGLYFDTDYELFKPIDNLMQIYDFIGAEHHFYRDKEDGSFDVINNAFLAATKSHPVINELLNLVKRNLHSKDKPFYIKLAFGKHNRTWVEAGPITLTVAFYKAHNLNKNNDILFKSKYFYPKCSSLEVIKNPEVFGCHELNGNWYGEIQ